LAGRTGNGRTVVARKRKRGCFRGKAARGCAANTSGSWLVHGTRGGDRRLHRRVKRGTEGKVKPSWTKEKPQDGEQIIRRGGHAVRKKLGQRWLP